MKRLLSLFLSGALLATLGALPVQAAEDSASARLTRVTQAVKSTLALDTERYDEFQGDYSDDELATLWSLSWSGEDGASLYVEALEDGTIVSFRFSSGGDKAVPYWGGGLPTFPKDGGADSARQAADAFLAKVLGPGEEADFQDSGSTDRLGGGGRSFYGSLKLNGLPSPLNVSVTVEDGQVVRFRRDAPATSFLGGIPAPEAKTAQTQAAPLLREKLGLTLEYVRAEAGSDKAVLRYVPVKDLHNFYVDANTGELLDMTELEKSIYTRSMKEGIAEDAAPMATASGADNGASLSTAELAGAEKLEGVQPAAKLDAALRKVDAYGLKGYTLASSSYSLDKGGFITSVARGADKPDEKETVICTLRYTRTAEDQTWTRNITVDARSGELRSVSTYGPWDQEPALSQEQARSKAEAFLKELVPERKLVLCDSSDRTEEGSPYFSFTFAQEVNGYPFRGNTYDVSIDSVDGTVYRLHYTWDEDVAFDSPEGIITQAAAESAWADSYSAVLAYRLVPQELSAKDPAQARLISQGMRRFYGLRLTYALEREDLCAGVDAKNGQVIREEKTGETAIRYTDLSGSSAKADIEKLARYGIGYDSDTFRPGAALTQWDLVCLLASLQGQRLDPASADKDQRDLAYSIAYDLGALTRAERSDSAAVTRGTLVRMLLNAGGYGPAARLQGIFTTAYADQPSIPAGDLGYAAIAQALGLASGTYAGSRSANRGEAASMLCRLLERAG